MSILSRSYAYLVLLAVAGSFAGEVAAEARADGAFRKAFDGCAEKVGRPERGQPPSDDFKSCMKAAGFDGPPRGHRRGPRPGDDGGPPPNEGAPEAETGGAN